MASQIAAQLYTLRAYTKTAAEIATTLQRVKKIGYEAVQVSGMGKIEPSEMARILKGEGLTCCATHISLERMRDETNAVIEEHALWGCELTAVGGVWPRDPLAQTWIDWAKDYNAIAKKFAAAPLRLGYHNHSHELVKYGKTTALDLLSSTFDSSIWMEVDTYWITHGGGDPAVWIEKFAGRIPAVHLKDMGMGRDGKQFMMEVGEGNLNFPKILEASRAAGVNWFIVEQDDCYRDPFDSLETSLKNLNELGLT